MKKNQGFTLVELVIVIVILGILAVTAAPKFLNLSSDAKISTLKAVQASIQSANAQVYAKALIASKQKEATHLTTNPDINLVYGYIAATVTDMTAALDLATNEWTIAQGVANSGLGIETTEVTIRPASSTALAAGTTAEQACALVYTAAANADTKPVITLLDKGC